MKRKVIIILLFLTMAMPKVASATAGIQPLHVIWIPTVITSHPAELIHCKYSNCIKATQISPIPPVNQ